MFLIQPSGSIHGMTKANRPKPPEEGSSHIAEGLG